MTQRIEKEILRVSKNKAFSTFNYLRIKEVHCEKQDKNTCFQSNSFWLSYWIQVYLRVKVI